MLGATEVWLDGHLLDLGAHKPRAVLAALALSAARGDRETAAAHADEALRLIDLWDLPLCRTWFEHQRATYAF